MPTVFAVQIGVAMCLMTVGLFATIGDKYPWVKYTDNYIYARDINPITDNDIYLSDVSPTYQTSAWSIYAAMLFVGFGATAICTQLPGAQTKQSFDMSFDLFKISCSFVMVFGILAIVVVLGPLSMSYEGEDTYISMIAFAERQGLDTGMNFFTQNHHNNWPVRIFQAGCFIYIFSPVIAILAHAVVSYFSSEMTFITHLALDAVAEVTETVQMDQLNKIGTRINNPKSSRTVTWYA